MLELYIPKSERFNDETCEFVIIPETILQLEHSLLSLSKWESKWHKSFIASKDKTPIELLDYVRCMTLNKNVDPVIYLNLTDDAIDKIQKYIEDPMTATTINDTRPYKQNKEILTAEVIYYYMIALNIPFECQKWHLNRLMTLIKVCSIKNQPDKKMSTREILNSNRALNEQRKKMLRTKG